MCKRVFAKPLEALAEKGVLGFIEREAFERPYVDNEFDLSSKGDRK